MTMLHALCDRIARWPPVARIDAMYLALPARQRLLLWLVSIGGGFSLPPALAGRLEVSGPVVPGLVLGLFVGQVLLFTWLGER